MLNKFKVKKGIKTTTSANGEYAAIPPGVVIMHSSSTIPDGWLLCDGSSYQKSLYPDLDSVLSTSSYPFGSSSTTFNVPNLSTSTPIAAGSGAGLTTRTVGASGGGTTVLMIGNNLPSHQHGLNNHQHNSNNVDSAGSHSHTMNAANSGGFGAGNHTHSRPAHAHGWYYSAAAASGTAVSTMRASGTTENAGIGAGDNASSGTILADAIFGSYYHGHSVSPTTGGPNANHTHTFTTADNAVLPTGGTLTPNAVNVENPYLTICFIIKY